jgi:hypothetical protein
MIGLQVRVYIVHVVYSQRRNEFFEQVATLSKGGFLSKGDSVIVPLPF